MKRLAAVFCLLGAAVLDPAVARALTLHTPAFTSDQMYCSIVNVGSFVLQVDMVMVDDFGKRMAAPLWRDLAPGRHLQTGVIVSDPYVRCVFNVRAKSAARTATADMVRAAVRFVENSTAFSFEAR